MDDIVKQAMAKWPRVPHCYGWLALDGRGAWRMRDERVQHLGLAGDRITQAALLGFIERNYGADERGCWYFQNGPQRVYVNLETTPFVARSDPARGLVLHTGAPLGPPQQVAMTADGSLVFQAGTVLAQLDDRDLAAVLTHLEMDGAPVADARLLDWLADPQQALMWHMEGAPPLPVQALGQQDLAAHFAYVRLPQPD